MQSYTPLGSTATTTLKEAILNHENNINALRSANSGTSFPTDNLIEGMHCYRTDEEKEYIYTNGEWKEITGDYVKAADLATAVETKALTVTGETSVPTPATTNNSTTIANTEFVHGVVNELVNGAPTALDTLQELASALGNDPNFSTTILDKIGEKESKTDAAVEYAAIRSEAATAYATKDEVNAKQAKGNYVSYTANEKITAGKFTGTTYKYGQSPMVVENGLIIGGTAANAGLITRGICGVSVPDSTTGACTTDHLYINYDKDDTYSRVMVLGAGSDGNAITTSTGTTTTASAKYGNMYAAIRGDQMVNYVVDKLAAYKVTVDGALSDSSANPVQNKIVKAALDNKVDTSSLATVATSGRYSDLNGTPTVDTDISATSTNAVQNKAISAALDTKADSSAFSGASSTVDGAKGLVPTPKAGEQDKFLGADGTWKAVSMPLIEDSDGDIVLR